MNNMKRSMKRVCALLILMFLCIVGSVIKIVAIDSYSMINNSYNPRLNKSDDTIKRGDIKDINGEVLAYSELSEGLYVRKYIYGRKYAHLIGFVGMGKSGLESIENFQLQTIHNEILQRIKNIVSEEEIKGNDIILTVDTNIQSLCYDLLGDNKGAIVALEPKTGRIIAMVSNPSFDSNTIKDDWEFLKEEEDGPLLNRAVQGMYPPGSTFKLVTALSAMRNTENREDYIYNCTGIATFEDKIIHCFNQEKHGEIGMQEAFAYSCNTYFATLAQEIGGDALIKTANSLNFNIDIGTGIGITKNSFVLDTTSSESELVETSIGQGKTLVTPIYMAMIASAVANDGIMYTPYAVDHTEDYKGNTLNVTIPSVVSRIMTEEESAKLKEMMIEVINTGTGTVATIPNYQVAGKTGTAENPGGTSHSWFVGFAPADDPQIVVSIVLENPVDGRKASPIAKKIFDKYLNN